MSEGPPRSLNHTIPALAAAHLVTDLYMPVLPAILPLLIAENGYSYLAAGLLVTAYNVTSSFVQPLVGWLSDRRGFSVSVSASLLVSAVFVALMGVARDYHLVMLLAVIAALGHGCFHPTALTLTNRLCTRDKRGEITSDFVVGGNIGYAIGPVLAGLLVSLFGLTGLLLLVFPAVMMVLALGRLIPGGVPACPPVTGIEPVPSPPVSKGPFVMLLVVSILRAWAVFAALTYLPVFLVSRGYTLMAAGAVMTLMLLAGVAGQVLGGRISDRIGRKEYMILGLAGTVPFFWLFLISSGTIAVVAILLFGFFLWSTFAVAVAMSHELLPENIGLASGMMLGVAIGFGGLGVSVNGMIADRYSLAAALSTIPLPILLGLCLMVILPYPWKAVARGRRSAR